jgi:formylmethanofuran dehydrogenase subunit B
VASKRNFNHLRRIPTIVLDYPTVESPIVPTIGFTTAVYGVHRPGVVYRMDGVPIPLRKVLTSDYPSYCELLTRLAHQVISHN